MSAAAPSDLAGRFGFIIDELRHRLAFRAAKDRAFAPLLLILWNRLSRVIARFAAIAARQQAGTLRKPQQPRRPRGTPATPPPRDPLPHRRGWLRLWAPESIAYGEYLRRLLEEPEMQALIEQAPQLRRILRPLCRMLGVTPPILQPPAPQRPARPKPTRPRPARPKPARPRPATSPSAPRPRRSPAKPPAEPAPQNLPAWVPRLRPG